MLYHLPYASSATLLRFEDYGWKKPLQVPFSLPPPHTPSLLGALDAKGKGCLFQFFLSYF